MKLKMAKNSIFAVLLRSPWWMSAGVAVLLSAGGFAALPLDYAAMGVFAAVPFAVIAIMAAYKQLRAPSDTRVQAVAEATAAMPWADFANTVEAGFKRDGCEVQRLQTPGADFALSKDGHVAIVSAKRWKAARVGVEPLRELQAAREKRGAREAIYIALGDVSDNAWKYAKEQGVSLMTAPELAKLLRDLKV
ncbi:MULTISPECIES: restriction endonuclease [Achromobacter]|uniref:Restriction endonuclease n=1 Tax=Achromobacter spanius TaxID=217203 RepID=A0ABY8GXE2_9BURK|nr:MULTISPECIES: restriction endonuclease [Achromobacter]WAI81243.1 restriction endonuclease [Achromobacter spanius]WEX96761.1 restriction endonuclease [Achromobacter sp. SS2-2022]WFP09524.1 restriction endonuclease [Achromobacter spanius]